MANFHFFTNIVDLQVQDPSQSYGPVQGSENSQFRVTTLFSSASNLKAFAVCKGKVFAQEVNGKINIVLKPFEQPLGILSPVKYYIYKGIDKYSLVDSNNINIGNASLSTLTRKIQESQAKRNAAYDILNQSSTPTTTPATISAVGLNLTATAPAPNTLSDTDYIDDVFLRIDEDEFQTVDSGDDLGQFTNINFGFEIILDGFGEGPTMETVRNSETIITANPNPTGDINKFIEDDKRDQILNYIDPCAFFANFFFDGILIKETTAIRKRDSLYNDVLSKFFTKNIIYLDIRNEHNHSLNYYRNYNIPLNNYAQIYLSCNNGSLDLFEYRLKKFVNQSIISLGWPIIALPSSLFINDDSSIPSKITLRLPKGDNTLPSIYCAQGYLTSEYITTKEDPIKKVSVFDIGFQNSIEYTEDIYLSIPLISTDPTSPFYNTTSPFYICLRYFKRITGPLTPSNLTLKAEHFIDNLFELTYLLRNDGSPKIPLNNTDVTQWHISNTECFVSSTEPNQSYIGKNGIAKDISNVYFFCIIERNSNFITDSEDNPSFSEAIEKRSFIKIDIKSQTYTDENNNPYIISFPPNALPEEIFDLAVNPSYLNDDKRKMIMLVIDVDELSILQGIIAQLETLYDKRLILRNMQTFIDEKGEQFRQFELFITGYQFINNIVEVKELNTSIKINNHSIAPRFFNSPTAGLNFDGLDSIEENRKHFSRSFLQQDSILNVRELPIIQNTYPHNVIFRAKGPAFFKILEKTKDTQNQTWYNIEWTEPITGLDPGPPDGSSLTNVTKTIPISPGTGWIRPNIKESKIFDRVFYPVASFEIFITDLVKLTKVLDNNTNSQNDSISLRLTRLREMTIESGLISDMFDKVIDSTTKLQSSDPDPVRLNHLYDSIPQGTSSNLQLFVDYMGVVLGNEKDPKIIDLHHLFVGLDALFHPRTNHPVSLWNLITLTLSNNIDMATWAGDIGAGPADYFKDNFIPPIGNNDNRGLDIDYEKDWATINPNATEQQRETDFLIHYYKTRAKDEDMLADVYAHSIFLELTTYLLSDTSFKNIAAALYYFSFRVSNENDKFAFKEFTHYLGLSNSIPFTEQQPSFNIIVSRIQEFASLWFRERFTQPSIVPIDTADLNILNNVSIIYAKIFLKFLEKKTV